MQDLFKFAKKNNLILHDSGKCQLCGANTTGGIFECISLYSNGFEFIDFSKKENHISRFLSVDAHALQHPELHGRWNNHFHLTRLHLIFQKKYKWSYNKSPLLSNFIDAYKKENHTEILIPPNPVERGNINVIDVINSSNSEDECKSMIEKWAISVYDSWKEHHSLVDKIANGFLQK